MSAPATCATSPRELAGGEWQSFRLKRVNLLACKKSSNRALLAPDLVDASGPEPTANED